MNLFNDLYTLSNIPRDTTRLFLEIMAHQDDDSNEVIIVTPSKAAAERCLYELGREYLSGKINASKRLLEASNGMIIKFLAIAELQSKLKRLRFKAMHFEK